MEKKYFLEILIEYLVIKNQSVHKNKFKFKTTFYKTIDPNNILNNHRILDLLKIKCLENDYTNYIYKLYL